MKRMEPRLAVAGYACTEMLLHMSALPDIGGQVTEEKYEIRPGGRAGNAAIAAARLGVTPILCAMLGDDADGRRLFNFYTNNGVQQQFLKFTKEQPTGREVLLHEVYFETLRRIVYPGASEAVTFSQITGALVSYPDALYITTELPFELVVQSARAAASQGIPVFLDAFPVTSRMQFEELPPIDLFIIDKPGAEIVARSGKLTVETCLRACMSIAERVKAKYYIIRLTGQGFFVYDGKYHNIIAPEGVLASTQKNPCPVDTEAAALAAAYLITGEIRRACAISAIASRLAREHHNISIANQSQVIEYCRKNDIRV